MYISHYFGEVFYREKAKISKINGKINVFFNKKPK